MIALTSIEFSSVYADSRCADALVRPTASIPSAKHSIAHGHSFAKYGRHDRVKCLGRQEALAVEEAIWLTRTDYEASDGHKNAQVFSNKLISTSIS